MKERYPYKDDAICHPGKWPTIEKGLQYLRELAVLEMIYFKSDAGDTPIDPDEVECTRPMWWKYTYFFKSSTLLYIPEYLFSSQSL